MGEVLENQGSEAAALADDESAVAESAPGRPTAWASRLWLPVILICAAYLSFKNLGEVAYWCDEAHVTIMARNYLSEGVMTGWNGRNLYGYMSGGALDTSLRPLNAPLDIWVCAASFKALGQSEFAGRLPFVLGGLAALFLFYRLVRLEAPANRLLQFFAVGSLGLSTAYLLYLRQARYFSLSALGAVMTLYGYRRYVAEHNPRDLIWVSAGAILHFYANPMTCAVLLLALGATHLILRIGEWSRREWLGFGASAWAFLICTLPYFVYYRMWHRPDHNFSNEDSWLISHGKLLGRNFRDAVYTGTFSWVLIPLVLWLLIRPGRNGAGVARLAREWGLLAVLYIAILALLSPQPTDFVWPADVRYQVAILPTLAALAGAGLWRLAQRSLPGAFAAFALVLVCNPWTFHPLKPGFQWLLPALLTEIHNPYPTVTDGVVAYLKRNAAQDDTIHSLPEHMMYPVEYYLGDKILLAGMLKKETTHLPTAVTDELPAHLWLDKAKPDWMILHGLDFYTLTKAKRFMGYTRVGESSELQLQLQNYTKAGMLRFYGRETQRPELTDHSFGPYEDYDPATEAVYVFKRLAHVGPETSATAVSKAEPDPPE